MASHMNLSERNQICFGLDTGKTIFQIADEIGRDRSTVSREIRKHTQIVDSGAKCRIKNRCLNRRKCTIIQLCEDRPDCTRKCASCVHCNSKCPDYVEEKCQKLLVTPYVCNGCEDHHNCVLLKRFYIPDIAQKEYRETLTAAREGYNMTTLELRHTDEIVTPLLKQGQSIHHIVVHNKDQLTVSESTIDRLVKGKMLTATVLDQQRVCKLKIRKGTKTPVKVDRSCRIGREIEDYYEFQKQNPEIQAVQMDTVIGKIGGKSILTFIFPKPELMLGFICNCHTAAAVRYWIDQLFAALGDDYSYILQLILTDNGTEFSDPHSLEFSENQVRRSYVFYCDPMASWQKPQIERNHEFIRLIRPKGSSFDDLTQEKVGLMMSHINSYSRPSLGDRTPFEAFAFMYGQECLDRLLRLTCQTVIAPNEVCLTPNLLR